MDLHISPVDGVPIYLQIVNQVKYLVASGQLTEGAEMPSIRVLAEQLLVNPNTIARAYRELEASGVLCKRRATGTYVSASGSPLAHTEQRRILALRIDSLLAEAHQMNFALPELLALVQERHAAFLSPEEEERTYR